MAIFSLDENSRYGRVWQKIETINFQIFHLQDPQPGHLVQDAGHHEQEHLHRSGGGGRGAPEGEHQHQGVVQALQTQHGTGGGVRVNCDDQLDLQN